MVNDTIDESIVAKQIQGAMDVLTESMRNDSPEVTAREVLKVKIAMHISGVLPRYVDAKSKRAEVAMALCHAVSENDEQYRDLVRQQCSGASALLPVRKILFGGHQTVRELEAKVRNLTDTLQAERKAHSEEIANLQFENQRQNAVK